MPDNILVTGRPGSGKTTLVARLAERFSERGFKTGGFVTDEIKEGPQRVGFRVRDLKGETAILAHIAYKGKQRVGKYGVDLAAFERIALHALRNAEEEADLLIIDEIGRMELLSSAFRSMLLELLDAPVPLLATAHTGSDEFLVSVLSRDDISLYTMGATDRDSLLEVIDGYMRRVLTDN